MKMFVEAPLAPGARVNDAAQYLMAELDRQASERNRKVAGPVTVLEGGNAFERYLRLEAHVA